MSAKTTPFLLDAADGVAHTSEMRILQQKGSIIVSIEPWFNGLPEPIKVLLFVISGVTSLCTAGTAFLYQCRCLCRLWMDRAAPSEKDPLSE